MNAKKLILLLSIIGLITISCKNEKNTTDKKSAEVVKKTTSKVIHKDVITWKGYKPTGSHYGVIKVKSTDLKMDKEALITGSITIDMATIKNSDLKDPQDNKDLIGHLSNADFFDIVKYPTAKFQITNTSSDKENVYEIEGDLTIKGITKKTKFQGKTAVNENGDTVLRGVVKIDRTDFGIEYKSKKFFNNLKNAFINDEFDMSFKIKLDK